MNYDGNSKLTVQNIFLLRHNDCEAQERIAVANLQIKKWVYEMRILGTRMLPTTGELVKQDFHFLLKI